MTTELRTTKVPYFTCHWRNPGHWDITDGDRRVFRIRGEQGRVVVFDEREKPGQTLQCLTVGVAMGYIAAEMMAEA